jgi:cysteinyl-tRNA synthetase
VLSFRLLLSLDLSFSIGIFSVRGNDISSGIIERFGPNEHDYKLCDDAGPSISPLSDDEIHNLIAERLRCKLNRDFERADEIKVDLLAKDVAIDDLNRMWRADGVRIFVAKGRNSKLDYTYAPDAGPSQATMTDEEVAKLLADRQKCRFNYDFDDADLIRSDLWEAGVQIDDKNRLWRADGKSFRNENRDGHNDEDLFGEAETYHGDKGSGFR